MWSAISLEGSQILHPLLPTHGPDSTSLAWVWDIDNVLVNGVTGSVGITGSIPSGKLRITTITLLTLASEALEISRALVPDALGITVSGLTVLVLLNNMDH